MTGLDAKQVDWLHEQVAAMVVWDSPTGRPRVLPLYTALVMVLFALRHNLPPDVLAELFGCGSSTVERYQDELEVLVELVLTPLYEQIRSQARRDAVLVDGLVVPIGERDGVDGLFFDKKGFCGAERPGGGHPVGPAGRRGRPMPGRDARQQSVPRVRHRRAMDGPLPAGRTRDGR